jgi:hypothetical protein
MLLYSRDLKALPPENCSRLTYRRLRRPTRLPRMSFMSVLRAHAQRLNWFHRG